MTPAGWLYLLGLDAALTAVDGSRQTFDFATPRATVVVFVSTVCPVANDYNRRLGELWSEFGSRRDVRFLVVYPNKTESLEAVREHAAAMGFRFPVYRDDNNALADRLGARITPTAVVTGADGAIRYLGPIDDAVNPARVKRRWLREAIRSTLAGRKPRQPVLTASAAEPYG